MKDEIRSKMWRIVVMVTRTSVGSEFKSCHALSRTYLTGRMDHRVFPLNGGLPSKIIRDFMIYMFTFLHNLRTSNVG